MGWLMVLLLAAGALTAIWRLGRLDRAGLQFVASALLLALAGYVWQGSPGVAGRPKPPPAPEQLADTAFAEMRRDMIGRFDTADRWLTMADSLQRSGDTRNAAGVIRAGLRAHPGNATLWLGYANALYLHGGGLMSPAVQLAFRRAAQRAPDHPAPPFFYGLALAQSGQLDEAERIWRGLAARVPAESPWKAEVERQLQQLAQVRATQR
jgi:cytochrome c-type biogenesis protein CcmH